MLQDADGSPLVPWAQQELNVTMSRGDHEVSGAFLEVLPLQTARPICWVEEKKWCEQETHAEVLTGAPQRKAREGKGKMQMLKLCFLITVSWPMALPSINTARVSAGSLRGKKSEKGSLSFVNTNINICTTERKALWGFSPLQGRDGWVISIQKNNNDWWLAMSCVLCHKEGIFCIFLVCRICSHHYQSLKGFLTWFLKYVLFFLGPANGELVLFFKDFLFILT